MVLKYIGLLFLIERYKNSKRVDTLSQFAPAPVYRQEKYFLFLIF